MSVTDEKSLPRKSTDQLPPAVDEGGLHAPKELHGWGKAWWWFDFIVLVNLARLRFIFILVVIGVVITKWDTLSAYYDKWTRPATAAGEHGSDVEYFCPMHPSVISESPKDKCPICFMPLSKRKKGSGQDDPLPDGVVSRVQLSPYRIILAGVQTSPVEYQPLTKAITAVGFIEFNERNERTVSARVAGRIDTLFVNETGQMVQAGDDLASIYSPELFSTIQNLVDARKKGNRDLLYSARTRLQLLGIDDDQINEMESASQAATHVKIRSPIRGHVIKKYVREGQYVQEGTPLFDVVDLSTVWIQAQIYEDDIVFLPAGYEHGAKQPDSPGLDVAATTRAFPDQIFKGKLAFIYPHVDQDTRTVTVRFELDNPGHKLRPGSTATVTLRVFPSDLPILTDGGSHGEEMLAGGRVLAVPESAVIDTGSQQIVYRQTSPGLFEGVQVALAPKMQTAEGATFYPVLRGLIAGERIVTNGSFLVDAETRLNPAAGSIYIGASGGKQGDIAARTQVRPSTPEDPQAKIESALAKLTPADRQLAEAQRFCPVLSSNRLGVMGTPVKLTIDGQTVFVCCSGCEQTAQENKAKTLEKARQLREQHLQSPQPPSATPTNAAVLGDADEEADIRAALAELIPSDRLLAEAQRNCAVLSDNRLGSMGKPVKLLIEGQTVFVCCNGCEAKANENPQQTLAKVQELKQQNRSRGQQK